MLGPYIPQAAAITTTARRDGDAYVIDGGKTWISNGGIADFYVVFARTGEAPGARKWCTSGASRRATPIPAAMRVRPDRFGGEPCTMR